MSWNYRLCKSTSSPPVGDPEVTLAIHEVYYDEAGNVNGWTDPTYPSGETWEEFQNAFSLYQEASCCRRSLVLDLDELEARVKP